MKKQAIILYLIYKNKKVTKIFSIIHSYFNVFSILKFYLFFNYSKISIQKLGFTVVFPCVFCFG